MLEASRGDTVTVGRVVQNAQRPLILSPERSRFSAYIFEDHKDRVHDGMFLIAEDPSGGSRIVSRVSRIQSYGDQSAIAFQSIHEFVTMAEMEPLRELVGTESRSVTNGNLNGFSLRPCAPAEVASVFKIPLEGVPLGRVVLDQKEEGIDFHLPEELIYRSAFLCGAKGSGKTSALRSLLPRLAQLPAGRRPAIVILDVEGEFAGSAASAIFDRIAGGLRKVNLSTDPDSASATLGLCQVHYEDLAYFAPNLPLNSMLQLESIAKELWYGYAQANRAPKAREILAQIQQAAWRRPAIHKSQKDALIRATTSDVFSLFDQAELNQLGPSEVVKEGLVTIVDVSSLTDDQQRVVALYLLSTITRYKDQSHDTTGVLLVMDEAQKLFPHKGDLKPEYADRLGKFVGHIVHRGRRRRLGVVLATQYPADVSREVADLCDTKLVFRMSGSQSWIKAALGDPSAARKVSELEVGQAFLACTGLSLLAPIRIQFQRPLLAAPLGPSVSSGDSSMDSYTQGTASVLG